VKIDIVRVGDSSVRTLNVTTGDDISTTKPNYLPFQSPKR